MVVAATKGLKDESEYQLRVATKFVKIAQDYYSSKGRDIDIIKLNGSIEIAPILGLSDVIVDLVETGTTLRENDLEVYEEIMDISTRLITNKAGYNFKSEAINRLLERL
jgi:ATP phosphoribosyltransferase